MAKPLATNKTALIIWLDPAITLVSNTLGNGTDGNAFLHIDDAGAVKSYTEGNPSFSQTLTQLETDKGYLVSSKRALSFPDSTLGI